MYTMQVISHVSSKTIALMHVQRRHKPTPMQIDCGNVLLEKYLRPHFKLCKTSKMLHMYSDQVISVREVCKLHLMNPLTYESYSVPFYVMHGNRLPVPFIGSKAAQQMEFI